MEINVTKLKEYGAEISVLYAEDDKALQQQTALFLGKFFHKIDTADEGESALSLYKKSSYDIVITDIAMPKRDGIGLIRSIRELNTEQCIIVTSAYAESHYFIELINLGVERFILKPVDNKQLLTTLYMTAENIYAKKEAQRLRIAAEGHSVLVDGILNEIDIAIAVWDRGKIQFANRRFLGICGVESVEAFYKRYHSLDDLFLHVKDYCYGMTEEELIENSALNGVQKVVIHEGGEKGAKKIFAFLATKLPKGQALLSLNDITGIEKDVLFYKRELLTNPYTGLLNRVGTLEEIRKNTRRLNEIHLLVFSITNFDSIIKWHGMEHAHKCEKVVADRVKEALEHREQPLFFGNFDKNCFVLGGKNKTSMGLFRLTIESLSLTSHQGDINTISTVADLALKFGFASLLVNKKMDDEKVSEAIVNALQRLVG